MQSVAVGWQVYEITHRPLDLGLTGLVQFLPGILLFLVAGHVTDRFDRRKLLGLCYVGFATSSALLLYVALHQEALHRAGSVRPIFAILFLVGAVRTFSMPSSRALLPQLVPEEHFQNAVAWNSSMFQFATILGPAMGGLLYAMFRGPAAVYRNGVDDGDDSVSVHVCRSKRSGSRGCASRSASKLFLRAFIIFGSTRWCSAQFRWTFSRCFWAERLRYCRFMRKKFC